MKQKILFWVMPVLLVVSMMFSACTPTTPAVTQQVVVQATEAVESTELPTQAPTEAATQPPTESPTPEQPIRVVLVEPNSYTSLDPFTNASHWTPSTTNFGFLLTYSPDYKSYLPLMAESWEFSEDNLTFTMKLRPDAVFSDGTPVDAEAIKWVIDKYLDPDLASPAGGNLRGAVQSVEVVDQNTVQLNMIAPFAYLLDELAILEIPSPTAYQSMTPELYSQKLTAAGEFVAQEVVPDQSILFGKNETFHWGSSACQNQGPMQFDELLIRYVSDEAVAYASLETGEVDISPIAAQYLEQAKTNPNITVIEAKTEITNYLGFNHEFHPFDVEAVRQAFAYAINRQEIVDIAYEGQAEVLYQPLAPGNVGYNPELEEYSRQTSDDVEKANAILDELGYLDTDGDGIRETDTGEKMEYSLLFPTDPTIQRIAETLQAQISQIGVSIYLEGMDSSIVRERTSQGTHHLFTWQLGMVTPNITTYAFYSERIGASNRSHVNDPELDALLLAQDQETDPILRQAAVDAVSKYLIDHRIFVPFLSPRTYTGYRNDRIVPGLIDNKGVIKWCDLTVK